MMNKTRISSLMMSILAATAVAMAGCSAENAPDAEEGSTDSALSGACPAGKRVVGYIYKLNNVSRPETMLASEYNLQQFFANPPPANLILPCPDEDQFHTVSNLATRFDKYDGYRCSTTSDCSRLAQTNNKCVLDSSIGSPLTGLGSAESGSLVNAHLLLAKVQVRCSN